MVIPLGECGIPTASIKLNAFKMPKKVSILKLSRGAVNPQVSKLTTYVHIHVAIHMQLCRNAMQYMYIRNSAVNPYQNNRLLTYTCQGRSIIGCNYTKPVMHNAYAFTIVNNLADGKT